NIIFEPPPCVAITPTKPVDSLSMGDEHLDTILATESDEFIKSSVENLVPNPSESEGENNCDVPACFTTFSNVLFDAEYDFDYSDDHDSHMEEIDLSFNPDDPMPLGIEEDDDDSERDIPILEELLDNYSLSLPKNNQEKSPDLLPHQGLDAFQSSAECPMMINGKNTPILDVPLFHFYPLDQLKYGGKLGQAQRPKTSASWEATHAYQF
nr:hypothetical protein [Tanacetum cinerariifolium]